MKWCPKCRQEYLETAQQCAECAVALVDRLDPVPDAAAAARDSLQPCRLHVPSELLSEVRRGLERSAVPVRLVAGEGAATTLEIPLGFARGAVNLLAGAYEIEPNEADEVTIVARRVLLPPPDRAVLRRSSAELVADAANSLPALTDLLERGEELDRRGVVQHLAALVAAGRVEWRQLVNGAIRGARQRELYAYASELARNPPSGLALEVALLLVDLGAQELLLALHFLAQLADPRTTRAVWPLLEHDDPEVRAAADDVLMSATGRDMLFGAEAEPAVRARAMELWRSLIDSSDFGGGTR